MKIITFFGVCTFLLCGVVHANQVIPMSDSLYQGKYFLISNVKENGINKVTYKSVFRSGTVFSKMEIKCSSNRYRKIGEGDSIRNISIYSDKGNWVSPIEGASDYDVLKYACKKK